MAFVGTAFHTLFSFQFFGEFGREVEDVFIGSATLKHSTQQLRSIATMLNVKTAITTSAMLVSFISDRLVDFAVQNDPVNLFHLILILSVLPILFSVSRETILRRRRRSGASLCAGRRCMRGAGCRGRS